MKVICEYCGEEQFVPPCRLKDRKNLKNYCCGKSECRAEHMKRMSKHIKRKGVKKDFSQLKKLNNLAKRLGHKDLFMN